MQFLQTLNGTRLGTLLQTILYISGVPLFQDNITSDGFTRSSSIVFRNLEVEGPHPEDPLNTRCYGALGCITVKYPDQRGFHLFPEPLQDIKPDVCLFTYAFRDKCQPVDTDRLDQLVLGNTKEDAYWITHGYIESSKRPWIQRLTEELLEHKRESNVFVIDWSKGAEPPYNQAVANVELSAAYVAHLMLVLEEAHGLNVSKIHFIGHSLGAHFAGFVGSWLINHAGVKMARISGLDPAQPYFQNYPHDARLDPTDAEMVDVIHTDAKPLLHGGSITGLGTQEPSGHVDFYPNSGKDQPGCKDGVYQSILQEDGSLISGIRRFIGCDHIRAYEYFTESIRSSCAFTSFSCSSWNDFVSSECSFQCKDGEYENCNHMGYHAKKPSASGRLRQTWDDGYNTTRSADGSVLYYSITGSRAPYCRQHYQVTLNLGGITSLRGVSNFHIVVFGPARHFRILRLGERDLRGKLSTKFVIGGAPIDFEFERAVLKPSTTNPIWWFVSRMARSPDLAFTSISILHLERAKEIVLCPEGKPFLTMSDKNPHVMFSVAACALLQNNQFATSPGFSSNSSPPVVVVPSALPQPLPSVQTTRTSRSMRIPFFF